MPRQINSSVLQQLTGPSLKLAIFVMLTFKSETCFIWSGIGTVYFNGHSWTGIGSLLNISTIEDGNTVDARGVSVTVSGLDPLMLGNCMSECVLGLPAAIYLGVYSNGTFRIGRSLPNLRSLSCRTDESGNVSAAMPILRV